MTNSTYKFWSLGLITAALMLAMTACSGSIPPDAPLERNWGRAFETQIYLQTANPEAGKTVQSVMVMDGPSSDNVMQGYRESFSSEGEEETVNIIKLR